MELLQQGLVEKGLKGELYARLVLTLARDCVWKVQSRRTHSPTFTVDQFLKGLYGRGHRSLFRKIPAKLLNTRMNFNHFLPTRENLRPAVLPEVLHDLLRRSAAMQLAFNQPTYDIMIPIYFGDSAQTFDASECGAIMIQVKNKGEATTPWAVLNMTSKQQTADSDDNSALKLLKGVKGPVLFLLFDLGTEPGPRTPRVQVSDIKGTTVWAIHSRGHDGQVFGCLSRMKCDTSSGLFFTSTNSEPSDADTLCERNMIFSELSRNSRYSDDVPSPVSGPAKRKSDNSTEGKGPAKRKRVDDTERERPVHQLRSGKTIYG
jgi:hypothetical protein